MIFLQAILSGYFCNIARISRSGDHYRRIKHGEAVYIHPSSVLFSKEPSSSESLIYNHDWVLYHELVFTSKEYMRQVLAVKPEWLSEVAPFYYKKCDIASLIG